MVAPSYSDINKTRDEHLFVFLDQLIPTCLACGYEHLVPVDGSEPASKAPAFEVFYEAGVWERKDNN